MMKHLLCWLCLLTGAVVAGAVALNTTVIPDGWGVNVHFTGNQKAKLDNINAAGWKFIRMDFKWELVEKTKGVYDFTPYDQLSEGLAAHGMLPVYILDYSNVLYEKDRCVVTEEAKAAFARFAAAAVTHFKGQGVVWELWNEPNGATFWKPAPSATLYMAMAKVVLPAMRKADPNAFIMAPGVAGCDADYLRQCFDMGLLSMVDAVSFHPYRRSVPETVVEDYAKIRTLVTRAMVAQGIQGKPIPLISGEWGYSTAWDSISEELQGQYAARQYMINLSQNIPLSIWYDWKEDGIDPKDAEHHFGLVKNDEVTPKPGYFQVQRLVDALRGLHFVKRLQSAPDDYVMLFSNGAKNVLAAWTIGKPHSIELYQGKSADVTGNPQYLPIPADVPSIYAQSAWQITDKTEGVLCGPTAKTLAPEFTVHIHNPFKTAVPAQVQVKNVTGLTGSFTGNAAWTLKPNEEKTIVWKGINPSRRDVKNLSVTVEVTINGYTNTEAVTFLPLNPLSVSVLGMRDGTIAALIPVVKNEQFDGILSGTVNNGKSASVNVSINDSTKRYQATDMAGKPIPVIKQGEMLMVPLPLDAKSSADRINLKLTSNGQTVVDSGIYRIQTVTLTAANTTTINDGSAAVPAEFTIDDVHFDDPSVPVKSGIRFNYKFGEGWKFIQIVPKEKLTIPQKAKAIGIWVHGNQSKCQLLARIFDVHKRTSQLVYSYLSFNDWRYFNIDLSESFYCWGGEGGTPGIIDFPADVIALMMVDNKTKAPISDSVEFGDFQIVYAE